MIFKDKKIGVWGLGVVGQSVIRFFNRQAIATGAFDQKSPSEELDAFLHEHTSTRHTNIHSFLHEHDYIIPSPGIDLRPYAAFKHKWLSELDIFQAFWHKPIIAITGSVGKTSVTHLLSVLLEKNGTSVATGGNIGIGMLDLLTLQDDANYALLEVSSFQLDITRSFAPDLAIITNIYANHLDRHGTFEDYFDAKAKLLAFQSPAQKALLPFDLKGKITTQAQTASFDHQENSAANYFLNNTSLMRKNSNDVSCLCTKEKLPAISFSINWLIVAAALDLLGITIDPLLDNQIALPAHRLESIGSYNGALFFDDSKATIPASTLAALSAFENKPVILFIGGISKGVDRAPFIKQLHAKVKALYCFGKEAEALYEIAQQHAINAYHFETLEEAFEHAISLLEAGDHVLFSPAGASYDLYKNYQERGQAFKNLLQTYSQQ